MNITSTEQKHFLVIKLSGELFAINVDKVLEVLEMQEITKVPNMPKLVKGIINFRGDILPVIEARLKLNMSERKENEKYVIIVLDLKSVNRNLRVGFVTDKVTDVLEMTDDQIKDIPDMGVSFNVEFLQGRCHFEDGFLLLLDVDRMFTSEELNQLGNNHVA